VIAVLGGKGAEIPARSPLQPRPSTSQLLLHAVLRVSAQAGYKMEAFRVPNASIFYPSDPRTNLVWESSAPSPPCCSVMYIDGLVTWLMALSQDQYHLYMNK
jgi:hypothetical protein